MYELLLVLPGTLSEDDVAPAVDQVRTVLTEAGATDISIEDRGKSRLAYPIKHIRYGYFQLGYFQAEPAQTPAIQGKLRLMSNLLRAQINKFSSKATKRETPMVALSDVTIRRQADKPQHSPAKKDESAETRAATEVKTIKSSDKKKEDTTPKKAVETKAEDVKMEDIDKKLDELLGSGISDV